MRNVTILLAVLAVVAMAVPAGGAVVEVNTFTGGTSTDWNLAANWDRNRVPGDDPTNYLDKVYLAGKTADVTTPWVRTSGMHNIYLGLGGGGGTLNVAADFQSTATIYVGYGATSTRAFVNQTAGTVKSSGTHIYVNTDSVYTISGGNIDDVGAGVISSHMINGGEFKVVGNAASINFKDYGQDATSLTTFELTAAGTVSPIVCYRGNNGGAYQAMTGTVTVDDSLWTTPTLGTRVILFDSIAYDGYLHTFTSGNSDWGFGYNNIGGKNRQIYAEYLVPEPATMVLLGLGGLGVLIRRKRR